VDLNRLEELELVERSSKGVRARREVMLSFMPRVIAGAENDNQDLFPAIE
jgi:hypothetical protein